MTPESVGWPARRIVVNKLSGRRGLAARFQELGLPLESDALDRAYRIAMEEGADVRELDDRMLVAIAARARRAGEVFVGPVTAGD
jgi:2-isopropylmalate synthase